MPVDSLHYGRDHELKSPVNPSCSMYGLASATRKMLNEDQTDTLVIGTHPTMRRAIGTRLLGSAEFPEKSITEVVGNPDNVMNRLRQMRLWDQRRFGIVLAAYESHHIPPQNREEFVELMESLSHGTVIVADYAVALEDPEEVIPMAARKIDREQLALLGGAAQWFETHQAYTPETFFSTMQEADWSAEARFLLNDFGVGFVGSSTICSAEMMAIVAKALSVRSHTLAAICKRYSSAPAC